MTEAGKEVYRMSIQKSKLIRYREELNNSLKESNDNYKKLFEDAEEGIICLDACGNITDINSQLLKIIGYEREDVIGKNFVVFFTLLDLSSSMIISTFEGNTSKISNGGIEWKIVSKNGETLNLRVYPIAVPENEKMISCSIMIENVSQPVLA
jgi:PAS domain S-box-containing protein